MAPANANLIWKIADLLRGAYQSKGRRCGLAVHDPAVSGLHGALTQWS
jgi:hypothetical protein